MISLSAEDAFGVGYAAGAINRAKSNDPERSFQNLRNAGGADREVLIRSGRITIPTALALLWAFWGCPAMAAVCDVPTGSYPTIQDAIDDPVCAEVQIAAGIFVESLSVARSLVLTGVSSATSIIEGRLEAVGESTDVEVTNLRVDAGAPSVAGCFTHALSVSGGATATGNNVVVINGAADACPIFVDGFESGNTDAWSSTAP